MAEFKNDELKSSFTLPDKITVRKNLEYLSAQGSADGPYLVRLWISARVLVENWQSEHLQLTDDIDTVDTQQAADVAVWAGLKVARHVGELKSLSKNS
jgi:hypothetical protein